MVSTPASPAELKRDDENHKQVVRCLGGVGGSARLVFNACSAADD